MTLRFKKPNTTIRIKKPSFKIYMSHRAYDNMQLILQAIYKLRWIIPIIGWMCVIFYFSNQPAIISSQQSTKIFDVIPGFALWSIIPIRKTAHMFLYFVLCSLLHQHFKDYHSMSMTYLLSIGCSFLYACADEFHQYFIDGRTGMFTDALIDTAGATLSIMLIFCIYTTYMTIMKRKYSTIQRSAV